MSEQSVVIDAGRPRAAVDWRELWAYRELFLVFVQRDIAVRYQQTTLGILWALLQPLGLVLVFSIIFGRLARLGDGLGVPYPLFAFAGLLPWLFFAGSLGSAAISVLSSRGLISKVYFPRLIIPAAAVGAPLVDFACSTLVMLGLMAWYEMPLTWSVLAVPLLALLTGFIALAFGTFMAALIVMYRDVRHLLPFLISIWLFLTPVIYPPALFADEWRWLLLLNPMAGVVDGMRSAWFGEPFDLELLGASIAVTFIVLVLGVRYFRLVERDFVDVL